MKQDNRRIHELRYYRYHLTNTGRHTFFYQSSVLFLRNPFFSYFADFLYHDLQHGFRKQTKQVDICMYVHTVRIKTIYYQMRTTRKRRICRDIEMRNVPSKIERMGMVGMGTRTSLYSPLVKAFVCCETWLFRKFLLEEPILDAINHFDL